VSDTICFVNLEENITVKKILSNFKGDIIWMNTHYSDVLMDLDEVTTVPALSYYEEENLFVNLEGRPQKNFKRYQWSWICKIIKKSICTTIR
jgi:NADH dehydrogenase/NADH:ubiquinone oxidoreductase subunit G